MSVQAAPRARSEIFFKPRRLGHANLWVENLKRSESFYNKVCGFTVEFWEPDLVATFLGTGNTPHDIGMIETTGGKARFGRDGLLQIPAGIGTHAGLGHIAFELANEAELVDAYNRAQAAGIKTDMTVDHQVAHSVYMFDPDMNYVEFYCDTVVDWRNVIQGEMSLITGSWTPGESEPFTDGRWDPSPAIRSVDDAPVHPRRITHVVFKTQKMDEMIDFYARIGGLTPVYEAKDNSVVALRGSLKNYRFNIALAACAPGEKAGYHHSAFELASPADVDAAEKRCRDNGITVEKSLDGAGKRAFFLIDPDGLRSEYFARKTGDFADLAKEPAAERAFLI